MTISAMTYTPKVLLVEDLDFAQKIAVYALEACQCEVDIASNGTEAIEALHNTTYDLVLMDLGLPDIDGLTVTETIRRATESPAKDVPIIALTAHMDDNIKQDSVRSGMTAYVVKPLTEPVARDLLQRYVLKQTA
ncbi:MAG: GacS/BarA family sensor protein [Gammaproteobacteria bacterium]|nr:GacS/BarA family sensor protein [Gammaproteobacteria bacterium]